MQMKSHARKVLEAVARTRAAFAAYLLSQLESNRASRLAVLVWLAASLVYSAKRLVQHIGSSRWFHSRLDLVYWKREIDTAFVMKLVTWSRRPPGKDALYRMYSQNNRLTEAEAEIMRRQSPLLAYRPLISILVPVYNSEPFWLERLCRSVRMQTYDRWELIFVDDASTNSATQSCLAAIAESDERIVWDRLERNQGISAATNRAAQLANGEFLAFVDHDDELMPDALWWIVDHLQRDPNADLLYTDEEYVPDGGYAAYPYFKPDFSPEQLTAFNYMCHLLVVRKRIFDEVGKLRPETDGAQDHDLILRVIERTDRVAHIPRVLYRWHLVPQSVSREYDERSQECRQTERIESVAQLAVQQHFQRTGVAAVAEPVRQWICPRFEPVDLGKVSIIICTKDSPRLLWQAIRSIEKHTQYPNYEILIVDNGSRTWATRWLLSRLARRHRVLRIESDHRGFNFSALNNDAAREATGKFLLFLNDDTQVTKPGWLAAMVGYASRPQVGAVGARLLFPNRTLQHAGLIVGAMGWGPWHALRGCKADTDDAFGYMTFPHNCIAVTGACLLTPKQLFLEQGGFDETNFAVAFNDVDYCLRLHQRGYRCVVATQAELIHYESSTRNPQLNPMEATALADRYRGLKDPYWNPNYSRQTASFVMSTRRQAKGLLQLDNPEYRPMVVVAASPPTEGIRPSWEYLVDQLGKQQHVRFRVQHIPTPGACLDRKAVDEADVVLGVGTEAVGVVEQAARQAVPCLWHLPERPFLPRHHNRSHRSQTARIHRALSLPYRVVFNNLLTLHWFANGFPYSNFSCLDGVFTQWNTSPKPDRQAARQQLGIGQEDVVVLAWTEVGRDEEVRYMLRVFQAISAWRQTGIHLILLLDGKPEHRKLEAIRRQIRRIGPNARAVRDGTPAACYAAGDIFLTHALEDPRSVATLRAMECELPILGPMEVVQADLIHPSFNGWTLPRFSPRAAAKAILKLADNAQLREKMGRNSRAWLQSRSSPKDVLEEWESLIIGAAELRHPQARSTTGKPVPHQLLPEESQLPVFAFEAKIA